MSARRWRGRGALVLAISMVLVGGCGGGESPTEQAAALVGDEDAQETTTTEPPKVPAPLSGLPVDGEAAGRPAVSVKVDNSPSGRPQAGLDKADVIIEEKVEGGVTRFISVFQSRDSELVGPIRSLRTTDPSIVSSFGGVFVFSDGVPISLRRLRGAPVTVVSERGGAGPFTYPKGRRRPFATFAATPLLRRAAGKEPKAPAPAFSFLAEGEAFAPSGAMPATRALINFGGRTTASFDWDAATGTWLRSTNGTPHLLADGTRLAFSNVIIQKVSYRPVGYNDSTGNPVDEATVVGSGEAIVLVGGKQTKATWSKPSPAAMTVYTDPAGAHIKLAPGPTMVTLPQTSAPISIT